MFGGDGFFDDGASSRGADWAALKRGQKTMWQQRDGAIYWGSRTSETHPTPDRFKPKADGYAGGAKGGKRPTPQSDAERFPGKIFRAALGDGETKKGDFEAAAEVKRLAAGTPGIDINGRMDADGMTPIGLACKNRQTQAVRTLARLGADVDKVDEDGRTPCWWAAHANAAEALQVLCEHGADINIGDREQVTPLAHAISCRWASPQGEKDQATAGGVFKLAMGTSKRAAALCLLKAGADADLCAADGQSPLANAVHWENDEAFTRLIAQGVDVTARDELGRTALDVAVKQGIGKPWARVYPQVLRDETDNQRRVAALCSVYQRLALAKTVSSRLAQASPTFRWLPYDLLESIGLYLVPPKQENLSNGKSNPRTTKAASAGKTGAVLQAATWAQGARTGYNLGAYHQGLIIGGEDGSAPASPPVHGDPSLRETDQEQLVRFESRSNCRSAILWGPVLTHCAFKLTVVRVRKSLL
jgi:hypothetical protein